LPTFTSSKGEWSHTHAFLLHIPVSRLVIFVSLFGYRELESPAAAHFTPPVHPLKKARGGRNVIVTLIHFLNNQTASDQVTFK
jgi:hypothetical protein